MKELIINADDLGATPGINKGIIEGYQAGIITNVSLLVNMPGYNDAIRLIHQNPKLSVGIHLNITCGLPISSPDKISTLLNEKGYFLKWYPLVNRLLLKRIDLNQIYLEFKAQIEKLISDGITPIHMDTHQYMHVYPEIFKILIALSKEYNIYKIRYPDERFKFINSFSFSFFNKQNFKKILLSLLLSFLLRICTPRKILIKNGILIPNNFIGIVNMNSQKTLLSFENMLQSVKEGVNEIVCHPGYIDDELIKLTPYIIYVHPRKDELEAILHPKIKKLIEELNINLISYKEMM